MNNLSRRKYQDLIRFLRSVIRNEQIGLKVRMQAAERLDGIYARHEAPELRRLEREAKAGESISSPEAPQGTQQAPLAPESAQDAARRFLATLETKSK